MILNASFSVRTLAVLWTHLKFVCCMTLRHHLCTLRKLRHPSYHHLVQNALAPVALHLLRTDAGRPRTGMVMEPTTRLAGGDLAHLTCVAAMTGRTPGIAVPILAASTSNCLVKDGHHHLTTARICSSPIFILGAHFQYSFFLNFSCFCTFGATLKVLHMFCPIWPICKLVCRFANCAVQSAFFPETSLICKLSQSISFHNMKFSVMLADSNPKSCPQSYLWIFFHKRLLLMLVSCRNLCRM